MLLYLLRHGKADQIPGSAETALTPRGKEIVRSTLIELARFDLAKPERIVSSTFTRAKQTASIAKEVLGIDRDIDYTETLTPNADLTVALNYICGLRSSQAVLLVGHDPLFSLLATALLTGGDIPAVEMARSAVCAIELTRFEVPRMRGVLRLFLPPFAGNCPGNC